MADRTVDPVSALVARLRDGGVSVVDLTHPLSAGTPVLQFAPPLAPAPRFRLYELSRYDERGPLSYKNAYETWEHVGTHFDAPVHWITGRDLEDVASVPVARLIGPAFVLDRTAEVSDDPGYFLSVSDVKEFEREHGTLPDGSWLLFRSGWAARHHDEATFLNQSVWPGPDMECARYLASSSIVGFGTEAVGIDHGAAETADPPFPVHYHLLGAGKYGLASLNNLDLLPPVGALLIAAPLRIAGGSGSSMRALALVPRR